jgi:WD40 repeat protein
VRPPKQLPVDQWSVSFAFSDDGQLLAAGDAWGKVRLWDLATGKDRLTLDACTDTDSCLLAWRSLAITHDNRLLATGGGLPGNHDLPEYEIVVWDLASGKPLATFKSAADVRSVAFSPDGSLLAAGDWAGAVNIWDVATQQRLGPPLKWGAQGVESLAWSPDGRTLAAGGYQSGITLWNVSVDDWLSRVCAAAGRPLSQTEWQQAVGDSAPYDPVCPGLSG